MSRIFLDGSWELSFTLPESDEAELCRVCEKYLLNQLGRGFKTLDFYKKVKTM